MSASRQSRRCSCSPASSAYPPTSVDLVPPPPRAKTCPQADASLKALSLPSTRSHLAAVARILLLRPTPMIGASQQRWFELRERRRYLLPCIVEGFAETHGGAVPRGHIERGRTDR